MRNIKGFTLIELMVVIVIIAALAAMSLPLYKQYVRKNNETIVIQEMNKIATDLQHHKARNFSYKGYFIDNSQSGTFMMLRNSGSVAIYRIDLYDLNLNSPNPNVEKRLTASDAIGQNWAIKAIAQDDVANMDNFLMTSTGLSCRNRAASNITLTSCGNGGQQL